MTKPSTATTDVVCVAFPVGLYDVEAIKRTAYRFGDRLAVDIAPSDSEIVCRLRATTAVGAAELATAFRVEVLDQDLRIRIAKETEPLRNLILSLAFSRSGLQK